MARLISGGVNSRQIKGKLGQQVFKIVNRDTIIAAYQPIVRNPRTRAQMFIREKFVQVSRGSRDVYSRAFAAYGIKLNGHSAYTSVNKMVFNNPVVKSVGYADNYLPKYPADIDRLIGCNTDLSGEIFNYLAFRVLKSGNTITYQVGFSIPKGLFGYTPNNNPGVRYFGSNMPIDSLIVEGLLQGIYRFTTKIDVSSFAVNENYGLNSDDTAVASSVDGIGGLYKYTFKANITSDLASDPQNSSNYFISCFDPLSLSNINLIECYWPGVEKVGRMGATMFMFSTSQPAEDLLGEESNVAFLYRQLMLAVNDVSVENTLS